MKVITKQYSLENLELISHSILELQELKPNNDNYGMDILIMLLDNFVANLHHINFKAYGVENEIIPELVVRGMTDKVSKLLEEYFPSIDASELTLKISDYINHIYTMLIGYIVREVGDMVYRRGFHRWSVSYSDRECEDGVVMISFNISNKRYGGNMLRSPSDLILTILWRLS